MLRNCILLLSAGSLLSVGLAELSTDYARERSLELEMTLSLSMETVESTFTRDGEPMEGRGGQGGGSSLTQHLLVRDRVLAHEDGRPTSVRRSFEEAEGTLTRSFGEEEMESSLESPFHGLVFELTDDAGEIAFEVTEGDMPDEDHFQGQILTLTLDALLPPDDVSVGDTWELESDAIAQALLFDIQPHLFPAPEREEDTGERGGRRGGRGGAGRRNSDDLSLLLGAEFEAEAELAAMEEDSDGNEIARVQFTAEAEGEVEGGGGFGRGGGQGSGQDSGSTTYTVKLEGELVFSLAKRHPVSLSVEGTLGRITDRSFDRGEISMSIYREEAGSFEMTVEVSEASDDE